MPVLDREDDAEVGVGTLIVFIAMVLVAAVAAAVLIGTSGDLQARAQQTGKEATAEVSNNLRVVAAHGVRNSTSAEIYDLRIQIQPASGSTPMDLTRIVIRFSDGAISQTYNHSASALANGAAPALTFNATWIRGGSANFVIQTGDLVELHFNLYGSGLSARERAEILLIPEIGAPVQLAFRTPNTYSTDLSVPLV